MYQCIGNQFLRIMIYLYGYRWQRYFLYFQRHIVECKTY